MKLPRTLRKAILLLGAVVLLLSVWLAVSLLTFPSVAPLADPRMSMEIAVKDWQKRDHRFVVGPRNPRWTPYDAIPPALKKAVVAAEDGKFYRHEGVDYAARKEAIQADLKKGRLARGGSPITQQLAKNLYLRLAAVKDSGSIMPGHGGFLDRFDSLLLATPFVWLVVKLIL